MTLHGLDPGVAPRRLLDQGGGLRALDERGPLGRVLGDMDSAATDDRAAASAGAEFSESHSNRHDSAPCSQVPMRRRKSWMEVRLQPRATCTDAKECFKCKRVNHEDPSECPPNGRSGDLCPIRGQARMTRERIGAGPGRPNMVNGRLLRRFGRVGAVPGRIGRRPRKGAKKSLPPSECVETFDRYLSDLYSPWTKRIGALGQAPTFPDDSEAELQEDRVTLWRCVRMWRGYGDGFE